MSDEPAGRIITPVGAFLPKTGGAVFPLDALRAAGVDLRDPAPIQAAFDGLAGYVDQLERMTHDG